jgi:hypothetical protein
MTTWCWVQDTSTGHRYDVSLQRLARLEAIGAVREIPNRRRRARFARPAKHFRALGARSKSPATSRLTTGG